MNELGFIIKFFINCLFAALGPSLVLPNSWPHCPRQYLKACQFIQLINYTGYYSSLFINHTALYLEPTRIIQTYSHLYRLLTEGAEPIEAL